MRSTGCLLVLAVARGWHLPVVARHGAVSPRVRLAATEEDAFEAAWSKVSKGSDTLEAPAMPPASAADVAPAPAAASGDDDDFDFEAAFAQKVAADGGRLGVQAKAAASRIEREQKRATLQTQSNLKSASRGAQEQAAVATRDWRFWVAIIAGLSLLPVLFRG